MNHTPINYLLRSYQYFGPNLRAKNPREPLSLAPPFPQRWSIITLSYHNINTRKVPDSFCCRWFMVHRWDSHARCERKRPQLHRKRATAREKMGCGFRRDKEQVKLISYLAVMAIRLFVRITWQAVLLSSARCSGLDYCVLF